MKPSPSGQAATGPTISLSRVLAMELSQDVLTMIIDGADANLQSISYLLAGLPLADEQQYLAFAVGEQSFEWGD